MSARSLVFATAAVATMFYGCASILGIADDVNRAGEGGAGSGGDGPVLVDGEVPDGQIPGEDGGGTDGSMIKDARTDGDAVVPVTCDLAKDFATPVSIPSLNTASNEGSARFSENELTVYFDTDRGGGKFDLFTASRASIAGAFSTPIAITGLLNTAVDEFSPNETIDGLKIFFERQDATGVSRITGATRPLGGMFTVGTALANINSNSYTANPFARGLAAEIYYVSDSGLLTPINIYRAKVQGDGTYVGAMIASISPNDVNIEPRAPVVSKDGLTIYFATDKATGAGGPKGVNVYVAKRASVAAEFASPALVPNVNTDDNEQPTWISADGCRLYLATDRPGLGKQDLFVATRPK